MLGLVTGLLFSSCQTEDVSEAASSNDLNAKVEKTKSAPEVDSKIHEPVFNDGPSAQIHEPVWFSKNGFEECNDFPEYNGGKTLTVNQNADETYHGNFDFKNLNIGGTLWYCGVINVENTVNVHWAGVFNFIGEIFIGTEEVPSDLIINHGGHLNLYGHVDVSGDFVMNDGATLHFLGGDPEMFFIEVDGDIIIDDNVVIDEGIIINKEEGVIYFEHDDHAGE